MRRLALSRFAAVLLLFISSQLSAQSGKAPQHKPAAVIWEDPGDIRSRNLFYGPGGKKEEPQGPFKFVKEDLGGHNPKFEAEDQDGKKWKAKMGLEAQAEPVATRLLWAVGYFGNENYYAPEITVENLPRLKRGREFVVAPGKVKGVRLQRHPHHEKKSGEWNWKRNPFAGTREYNGLRVMMALISNWDLKDENNAIFEDDAANQYYEVTDVGTAFGASGRRLTDKAGKNNLKGYRKDKFISKVTPEYVDFHFPALPPPMVLLALPTYIHEIRNHWIGKHIPRKDVQWIAGLLAQLTPEQIRDAFRAGGYSPGQTEAFAAVVEKRIEKLKGL